MDYATAFLVGVFMGLLWGSSYAWRYRDQRDIAQRELDVALSMGADLAREVLRLRAKTKEDI